MSFFKESSACASNSVINSQAVFNSLSNVAFSI